jgi:hypothetical protein
MLSILALLFGVVGYMTSTATSNNTSRILSLIAIFLGGLNMVIAMALFVVYIVIIVLYFIFLAFILASASSYDLILPFLL